jgi:hypothetical protein
VCEPCSKAGPSLISPSSIVVGRSGSTSPPPRVGISQISWSRRRRARRSTTLPPKRIRRDGTAAEEKIPLYRYALFDRDLLHAAAKTYETFTAAPHESAACQWRVGRVSVGQRLLGPVACVGEDGSASANISPTDVCRIRECGVC